MAFTFLDFEAEINTDGIGTISRCSVAATAASFLYLQISVEDFIAI